MVLRIVLHLDADSCDMGPLESPVEDSMARLSCLGGLAALEPLDALHPSTRD